MKVLFLSGVFPDELCQSILQNSLFNVDSAADAFQQNILHGLSENNVEDVHIISSVFIGSFPHKFSKAIIGSFRFIWNQRYSGLHVGFLNLFGIKQIIRAFGVCWATAKWAKKSHKGDSVIIYSAHTPFIMAAWVAKIVNPGLISCLVVPDLPEFMNLGTSKSFAHSLLKSIDTALQNKFQSKIDLFVLLTVFMAEQMPLGKRKYIVLEGIVRPTPEPTTLEPCVTDGGKVITYTGTLTLAYGIANLLDGFDKMDDPTLQLWVCGGGEGEEFVRQRALRDPRVKFLGLLNRTASMEVQAKSTLLINPRGPEAEFTKYSFPSKILEYMVSGRPTLACPLPGIPADYLPYFFPILDGSAQGIADTLTRVLAMSSAELDAFGAKAREYVLSQKNPAAQIERILNLIESFNQEKLANHP